MTGRNKTNLLRFSAVSSIALFMALATPAWGQTASEPAKVSASVVDEILVTARKRSETVQEIPLSVTAFGSDALAKLGTTDISEVSNFTPGFTMEAFGGRRGAEGDTSRPVIRGQANILGETNAAVFVDGIPFSGSFLSFPFAAIDRLEVVKGPQAALFGRSTFAGAINVITKKGTNEFENNLTVTAATHDEYEINLSSSGPLVEDKLYYFLNGRIYDYGGEYKNSIDGLDVGDEHSIGINGAIDFRPHENVNAVVRAGFNKDDDGVAAQVVQSRFYNNCFLDTARQYYCGAAVELDETTLDIARLGDEAGLKRENSRISASIDWDIGGSGYVLTSNSGYTTSNSSYGQDNTFLGNLNNFAGNTLVRVEEIEQNELSTELRLDTPSTRSVRGTVGVFYYERDKDSYRHVPNSTAIIADFGTQTTENWAVFGAVEGDLGANLTARAELRYSEDTIGLEPGTGAPFENTFTSVTPRFTLDYQATDNALIYGVVSKGNKPGYINADPSLPANLLFADEESAWNYEIGTKTSWLDGAFVFNAAAYYIDWKQQQLSNSVFINNVPRSVVTNAGESEVMGVELESRWQISDALRVGAGYAYTNAEIKDFCDPIQGAELTGFDCVNSSGVQGGQTAGNQIPNSPKHHLTLSTEYVQPLEFGNSDLEWFVRGNFSYISKKYAQVANLAHTGDRNLLNLKTGISKAGSWRATFFVDNVLNDKTPSTIVRYADLVNGNFAPINANPAQNNVAGTTPYERGFLFPLVESRQYGVTLSYDF